jgi:hypothetical protein
VKTYDYIHYYRGYWSDGGKCHIRVYREAGQGTPETNSTFHEDYDLDR